VLRASPASSIFANGLSIFNPSALAIFQSVYQRQCSIPRHHTVTTSGGGPRMAGQEGFEVSETLTEAEIGKGAASLGGFLWPSSRAVWCNGLGGAAFSFCRACSTPPSIAPGQGRGLGWWTSGPGLRPPRSLSNPSPA
jgi:hypothetical protein